MKNRVIDICILMIGIFNVMISSILFRNLGVFVDEYNTSPDIVFGGDFWNYAYWVMMLFNALIVILSILKLLKKTKYND